MAVVKAVCISNNKGEKKININEGFFIKDHGLENDAHAGSKRQISLLAFESIKKMRKNLPDLGPGDFGENITTQGIHLIGLEIGTKLKIGNIIVKITQIGKKCHDKCEIFKQVGTCVMPNEGVFADVLISGHVKTGDEILVVKDN
ncbi:MAG: MOSC domain-containing protein [Candidatus Mcinerneyibacterium aminivorans]|uniref:MOSC domain-containing protein n=1 Tax=Candidatus Mcinerneyibacterium aminivorans TaxID=2703815 RepID=A0A5D0MJ39_9BACT|nr:MAG: MOSC domain-containing protein [Candidatus Mcinerneyibacterium aminivorans]